MNEKKSLKTKYIIIIAIIVIILVAILIWYNKSRSKSEDITKTMDTMTENQNGSEKQGNDEKIESNKNFEKALSNYIIKSIETYTQNGYIIKDVSGNAEAEKLSVQEFEDNKEDYINKIENMLEDREIFSEKFVKDDKECCTYNLEKVLNNLGIGTHMGEGIGCYDANGIKIYKYGENEINEEEPTNANIIKYFGYDSSMLVNNILDKIEEYSNNGNILKSTTGDVEADKLTLEEAKNNRETYYNKIINEIIDNREILTEIYFENNKLICKCLFEELLNELEIGTHMGAGIEVNEEGIQIFYL